LGQFAIPLIAKKGKKDMKIKKSIPIKLMLVLALTVGTVIAATPGSACTITVDTGTLEIDLRGTVDPSGQTCSLLGIPIGSSLTGLPCGLGVFVFGLDNPVVTDCPN
jgi:hypothetical protein